MTRYLDASALVKLLVDEIESGDLDAHMSASPLPGATSLIGVAETAIATARQGMTALAARATNRGGWLLLPGYAIYGLDVTAEIAQSAAAIGSSFGLRTLDAIHVATAHAIRGSLTEIVTYDKTMVAACSALGLRVVSPGA